MVSLKKEELIDNVTTNFKNGDDLRYPSFERREQLGRIVWKVPMENHFYEVLANVRTTPFEGRGGDENAIGYCLSSKLGFECEWL